eukprot:m.713194 g.713194  ORF g.713194 m.713194 type:complete len:164 (+) comp22970_c1_seq8:212-703(+)
MNGNFEDDFNEHMREHSKCVELEPPSKAQLRWWKAYTLVRNPQLVNLLTDDNEPSDEPSTPAVKSDTLHRNYNTSTQNPLFRPEQHVPVSDSDVTLGDDGDVHDVDSSLNKHTFSFGAAPAAGESTVDAHVQSSLMALVDHDAPLPQQPLADPGFADSRSTYE